MSRHAPEIDLVGSFDRLNDHINDLLAERDRLREINGELVAALEQCESAISDNDRSAGIGTVGFIALRRQLADAGKAARAALDSAKES